MDAFAHSGAYNLQNMNFRPLLWARLVHEATLHVLQKDWAGHNFGSVTFTSHHKNCTLGP